MATLDSILSAIFRLKIDMDKRFDHIDSRLNIVEQRLDQVQAHQTQLVASLPDIFEKAGETFEIVARNELQG